MATNTECSTIIPYYCATYWHISLVTVKIALAMQVKKSCFKSCFIICVWPVWISFFKLSFHSFIFLHAEQLLEYYANCKFPISDCSTSGNLPCKNSDSPRLIVQNLQQYDWLKFNVYLFSCGLESLQMGFDKNFQRVKLGFTLWMKMLSKSDFQAFVQHPGTGVKADARDHMTAAFF